MKKTLLCLVTVLSGIGASAQCTPNPLYTDSIFGVWPDTTENFAAGVLGQFYSDTLNLLIPQDAEQIDPDYPAVDIDSIQLVTVQGLPPGLAINCNSQTAGPCTYLPSQLGCGLIEGTPTATGTYPIQLDVLAWFTFLFPQSQAVSFTGYEIVVADNNTAVIGLSNAGITNVRNVPNPFTARTTIEFASGKAGLARVRVFNLVGEEMWDEMIQTKVGPNKVLFDGASFPEGVYLYKIEAGTESYTGRMALQR